MASVSVVQGSRLSPPQAVSELAAVGNAHPRVYPEGRSPPPRGLVPVRFAAVAGACCGPEYSRRSWSSWARSHRLPGSISSPQQAHLTPPAATCLAYSRRRRLWRGPYSRRAIASRRRCSCSEAVVVASESAGMGGEFSYHGDPQGSASNRLNSGGHDSHRST
jgi:hypothetical protein